MVFVNIPYMGRVSIYIHSALEIIIMIHENYKNFVILTEFTLQEREERTAGEEREMEKSPSVSLNSKKKVRSMHR